MKKSFIYLMCSVLLITLVTPLGVAAQDSAVPYEIEGITFIKDTDEESIYRIEEEGKTLEYHEKVKENKNKTTIHIKVYEIQSENKKKLIDNYKTELTKVSDTEFEITDDSGKIHNIDLNGNDEFNQSVEVSNDINLSEPLIGTMAARTVVDSGGSKIAVVTYRIFSDGSAEARMNENPKYKNTRKSNSNFVKFKTYADGLKSKEKDLVTAGLASFADDLIKAIKGGKLLSWNLVKKLVGGLVKVGPIGAAVTLYNYGKDFNNARKAYKAI